MKSPFPGMDPYIEARGLWGDFHNALVYKVYEALSDVVPERYFVRTGERFYLVLIGPEGKDDYPFVPDVRVTAPSDRKKGGKKGGTALEEPGAEADAVTMRAFIEDEHRETFVEIYETSPERLVTTVEVLSPSNKRPGSPGWEQYQRKRQSHLLEGINLVEIDLLRGGQRMPMLDPWPDSPYTILVARAKKPQRCKVWPAHYRRPLPTIPVPLAKPDIDVSLSLQPMVAEIYRRSRYAPSIEYSRPLKPPLGAEDTAWLQEQLRARK
jgi:hypothetical protein